jgi:type IV pilus assembly protein PilC
VVQNPDGKTVKGYFEAFSKVEVHSFLLSEGNIVYSIKTSKLIQLLHGHRGNTIGKIKTKDLIFMLAQLSTYIKAGIPLVESIKILIKQFNNSTYERILRGVIYDLTTGESFSEALSKQGEAFPRLLINMVKASEMTGELPESLDEMEEYYTESEETRKAMITAMMYPMIIFFVALGVGVFIMLYVVPKFVDIYNNMDNAEIPGITKAVLALSAFLQNNVIWLFLGLVAVILIFGYLYKNIKSFRTGVQWLLMHIPVIKNIIIYNEVTMFSKTFASLLSHNVFITDSMDILNKVTNNEIYKMLIIDTITNLAKGEKVSAAFKDQWAFPLPAYEMIVTGEKTGQLAEMMAKVSKYYQDLHKNAVARIKTFIEPIMILFLTGIVGVIVLSIVIPMFNMYDAIQE